MAKNISRLVSSFKEDFKDLNYLNISQSDSRFCVSGFDSGMISQVLLVKFLLFAIRNSLSYYIDFDLDSFVFHL